MSRNSEIGYHFYMVECDNKGKVADGAEEIDLEEHFSGLTYMKAEGLNKLGKPRVYTEKFADSDRLRVYKPDDTIREATTVTLSFAFVGDDRYETYHNFVEYISTGVKRYRDTARNKYLYFFVNAEIKPANEMWYGGTPYLTVDIPVQSIFGKTFDEPII
jgi:hypothetical protein